MSERDSYPPGVPCWVDTLQPDPEAAMRFYEQLFGWEFDGPGPGGYYVARLRDRDVAGLGTSPDREAPPTTAWNTYVSVSAVNDALAKAEPAGAEVLAGPIDAEPAGRLAVISDPTGAALGLWEAHERKGAQLVNEPGAWAMSFLNTPDPGRAKAFYTDLFGWETEAFGAAPGAEITLWRVPGYTGGEAAQPVPRDVVGGMMPTVAADVPPSWSVDFWIEDADRAAANAQNLGGRVVQAPRDVPGFRNAVLADPSGAAFSVSSLKFAPPQGT
jgi:uncharacterized protein